jgi:PhzF family phenazine biosynthesis protein
MRSFPFKKLDAFATAGSSGNPAAALYLNAPDDLSGSEMQRVARELKGFVSEVGFIARTGPESFTVRYFSSEKEVEFCGHATVAILYDLIASDAELLKAPQVLLETNMGLLPIDNRVRSEDAVYVHAPLPAFREMEIESSETCRAIGVEAGCLDETVPIGIVNGGLETLCVPFRRLDDVLNAKPDFSTLLSFCDRHALDVIVIFTTEVADPTSRLRTRVFAAPFGYLEDPATGSANSALGYHLHRAGLWDGSPIRIEQGSDRDNPNIVRLASVPDDECGVRVVFGGRAILRMEGRYLVRESS